MSELLCNKTLEELVQEGWIVVVDEGTDEIVSLRSVVRQWKTLTWADQTFYRAKYGFDENGLLELDVSGKGTYVRTLGLVLRPQPHGSIVLPENHQSGSNVRLQRILTESRAEVINDRYDETALVHVGPDGTVVLTNEYLWGLAVARDNPDSELDQERVCHWEISLETWCPTAPWWAIGPDRVELFEFS